MWADQALVRFIHELEPGATVLDIGAGRGEHRRHFVAAGLHVVSLDPEHPATLRSSWPPDPDAGVPQADGLWASHVLEHSPKPIEFLAAMLTYAKPEARLCVTVPPSKPQMVGGHINHYGHVGLLLYQACVAGWDLRDASWATYGYNLSLLCPARRRPEVKLLADSGDIRALSPWLPPGCVEGAIWPDRRWWG